MHGRAVALGAGTLLNALSMEAGPVIGIPDDVNGVARRCANSTPMAEPAPTLPPMSDTPGRCRLWRTTTRNDGARIL